MRLFLSEFICSGALSGAELPESLLVEGRAMRDSLVADFAALPDVQVVLTTDRRVPPPPTRGVHLVFVDSPHEEEVAFRRLAQTTDATCIIAPELDGLLQTRCRIAAELSPRLLNASPLALELCSDKLALSKHLQQRQIPSIPTASPQADETAAVTSSPQDSRERGGDITFPAVVKPRFGAGSQSIHIVRNRQELDTALNSFQRFPVEQQAIVQPLVAGRALSVAAFFNGPSSHLALRLPLAAQQLAEDGSFTYLGGTIPAQHRAGDQHSYRDDDLQVDQLIHQIAAAIPGLQGYIGFDLLLTTTHEPDVPRLLLVEINPRLTTSYLGYRQLTATNLAQYWLDTPIASAVPWREAPVHFLPDGTLVDNPPR